MARGNVNLSIDELIEKQEVQVQKSKSKYEQDVERLKDLYAKRDEAKEKALLAAVKNSSRTYDEIMEYLRGED